MIYTIFGYNNPSGSFFLDLISSSTVEIWGRHSPNNKKYKFVFCDLANTQEQAVGNIRGILVSFAPIWLLADFLERAIVQRPERFKELEGVIAISSSSFLTKQFAFSNYDKKLSRSLIDAHSSIMRICENLGIRCRILAPTLVYGKKGELRDRNVSQLIRVLRLFPFIFLPKSTGLRQPIHASQLAQVAYKLSIELNNATYNQDLPSIITLGGDETMSYSGMLEKIQLALPPTDSGRRCCIISIPDRIFLLIISLLLPINTRLFEALMRINSNLAGFASASELTGESLQRFPILPLL